MVLDWTGKACERLRTKTGIDSRCVETPNCLTGAHEGATERQGCEKLGAGNAIAGARMRVEGRARMGKWVSIVWRF